VRSAIVKNTEYNQDIWMEKQRLKLGFFLLKKYGDETWIISTMDRIAKRLEKKLRCY
jgi:hypothetical protein